MNIIDTIEKENFTAKIGLVQAIVCTSITDEEATEMLNSESPTGTSHPWGISSDAFSENVPNPAPCLDDKDRRHILFVC